MNPAFHDEMGAGYNLAQPALLLGAPMLDGEVAADVTIQVALAMISRHGLIAGATGTGKTTTLKVMAGELSAVGVPVFISDIKGDVTGIAAPNDPNNAAVVQRSADLQITSGPRAIPSSSCRCRVSSVPRSGRPSIPSDRSCWARSLSSTTPRPRSSR